MQSVTNNNNNRVQAPVQLGPSLVQAPMTLNLSGVPIGPQLDARPHTGDRKWNVVHATADYNMDVGLNRVAGGEFDPIYEKMTIEVELDPRFKGKKWWTDFTNRYVFYFDSNGDKIQVPFKELTFGIDDIEARKAKLTAFGDLFQAASDVLIIKGNLSLRPGPKHPSFEPQFAPTATTDLKKMTVQESKDSKGVVTTLINNNALSSLVARSVEDIDAAKKDAVKKRKETSVQKLKKAYDGIYDKVKGSDKKKSPLFAEIEERLKETDQFAASAALMMIPTEEEAAAVEVEDDGITKKEEINKQKKAQAREIAADALKGHLEKEIVEAKNDEGKYDTRANGLKWLPHFRARSHYIPGDKKNSDILKYHITEKYGTDELSNEEKTYVSQAVRLVKEDHPESLEWQLMQKAIKPDYAIQWTKVLGRPLTRAELVEIKEKVEGIDDYEADYEDAPLAPTPPAPSIRSKITSAATNAASSVTNTLSNVASAVGSVLPSGDGSRFDIFGDDDDE